MFASKMCRASLRPLQRQRGFPVAPTASISNGVYAAAVTPLDTDGSINFQLVERLIDTLVGRGCDGALFFGTTGEGPSFSAEERKAVLKRAVAFQKNACPDFKIMAGTGGVSLPDTIRMTRDAFDLGIETAVVLPPYFFKNPSDDGLTRYFEKVVDGTMGKGEILLYHFPQMAGVGFSQSAVASILRSRAGDRIVGVKDSSDNLESTLSFVNENKDHVPGFKVFAGSDSILADAVAGGAAGCITALANLLSPICVAVAQGKEGQHYDEDNQQKLVETRAAVKGLPGPAVIKALLTDLCDFPEMGLRPPLRPLSHAQRKRLAETLRGIYITLGARG